MDADPPPVVPLAKPLAKVLKLPRSIGVTLLRAVEEIKEAFEEYKLKA